MVVKNGNFIAEHVFPMVESSIQPHGYDLHIGTIHEQFKDGYHIISEEHRPIRKPKRIVLPSIDCYELEHGIAYLVTFRETIKVPENCVGFSTQRSSLMRNGVTMNMGVWDAGYEGKGTSRLICHADLNIHKDMGVAQLIFMEAEESSIQYKGQYQHEGVK